MFRRVLTCGSAARLSLVAAVALAASGAAYADREDRGEGPHCGGLPSYTQLKAALTAARNADNAGFGFDMWGTVVNRDGVVCAVAFTGANRGSQWPGSRVISAQKAYTANAFSLPQFALATANLYAAVQPGGSLFGLQHSNPVDTGDAYHGPASNFGQPNDPMVGQRVGGVNVFGGGLALYNARGTLVGAVGVSGDSSCADHAIAWRTRHTLFLDFVPAGPAGAKKDQIIYGTGGFTQPHCTADPSGQAREQDVVNALPATR